MCIIANDESFKLTRNVFLIVFASLRMEKRFDAEIN